MIKKLTNIFLAVLSGILLFTGCKKDEDPQFFEATEIESTCILNGGGDYIIQNQESLDSIISIGSTYFTPGEIGACDGYKFPEIDFDAYTIIGVARSSSCSEPDITHEVVLENDIVTFNFIRPEIDPNIPVCLSIVSYSKWYKITKTLDSNIKFNVQ